MDNMIDNANKIKVVIVDDEPQSILRLQTDLMELGDFDVIATSSSSMSAKTLVMGMLPDVLFLDVEMPGQTGFEVLQSIREEMPTGMIPYSIVLSTNILSMPCELRLSISC